MQLAIVEDKVQNNCICILAHNEQAHIAQTIKALSEDCIGLNCSIKVYANGCTDYTEKIVEDLLSEVSNLALVKISVASKTNAWNRAFFENQTDVLVFVDGDILPEQGAIPALFARLNAANDSDLVIAGCTLWPRFSGLKLVQKFVGFVQIPLHQDFLSGGLYAIKRGRILDIFERNSLLGIPDGIVAEDGFLRSLLGDDQFTVIEKKLIYTPSDFSDYLCYLARMRWQDEQLKKYWKYFVKRPMQSECFFADIFWRKINAQSHFGRFFVGLTAASVRSCIKRIFKRRIQNIYDSLGPVAKEGHSVLRESTRARSTK